MFEKIRLFEQEVLKIWSANKGSPDKGPCDDKQKAQCREEFGEHLDWTCKQCERNPQRASAEERKAGSAEEKEEAIADGQ